MILGLPQTLEERWKQNSEVALLAHVPIKYAWNYVDTACIEGVHHSDLFTECWNLNTLSMQIITYRFRAGAHAQQRLLHA
jgi:hypothetical protein